MNLRNVALISEHVSPLANDNTTDTAQAALISNLSKALTRAGHSIDIFTRWNESGMPEIIEWQPGIRVIHMKAGPVSHLPDASLLPFMDEFATSMLDFFERQDKVYNLVHATFWVSAMAAAHLKVAAALPYVVTFQDLADTATANHSHGTVDAILERVAIERHTTRHANHIGISKRSDKHRLITDYHIDPAKITTVPHKQHTDDAKNTGNLHWDHIATIISNMYDHALEKGLPHTDPLLSFPALDPIRS